MSATTKHTGWAAALASAGLIFVLYFFVSSRSTIWDRDEARFATATAEMIHSGNYLYPTFNGKLRPDKPILIYWLMSLPMRLFGPSEMACRFCSVLATTATCFLTYMIGRRLFSHQTGLWAMAILATTPLTMVEGAVATTDAVLLLCITIVFFVFVRSIQAGIRASHLCVMALAFGAGVLTKGPVAIAVPLLAMLASWSFLRKSTLASWLGFIAASGAGVILFLLWAVPANDATHGEFLRQGIGHHVVERVSKPLEHHGGNLLLYLPYYFVVVLAGFFPWILYLPLAVSMTLRSGPDGAQKRIFLCGWIIPTFILMSLVTTKLPHYIFPIWPALALLTGQALAAGEDSAFALLHRRWLKLGAGLYFLVALAVAAGLAVALQYFPVPGIIAGLLFAATAVICLLHFHAGRMTASAKTLVVGTVIFQLFVVTVILPILEPLKISAPLAEKIQARTAQDVPVALCGFNEASLYFYLRMREIDVLTSAKEAAWWLNESGSGVLVISRTTLAMMQQNDQLPNLDEFAAVKGFNYSKGKWVEVVAIGRKLPAK